MKIRPALALVLMLSVLAPAARAEDPLTPLVERLQSNPADAGLRKEIIALAQAQKSAPAVPEEARRFFVQGNSAFADAKTPADMDRAVQLYRDASNRAPWWADVYFNLAKALEQSEKFDAAIAELRLYLLAAPDAPDAREAQDRIYMLEEKSARVAKAAAEQAAAAQAAEEQAFRRKDRAKVLVNELNAMFSGKLIRKSWVCSLNPDQFTGCTRAEYEASHWFNFNPVYPAGVKFELSPDGEKILFYEGYDNGPQYGGSGYFPPKVGTPTDYTKENIKWVDSDGKVKSIDFWISTKNGDSYYQISDSPYLYDDPNFDPYTRWQYWKHAGS